MDLDLILKKYKPNDNKALEKFVNDGFVIYEDIHEKEVIQASKEFFMNNYNKLFEYYKEGKIKYEVHDWSIAIIDKYERTNLSKKFTESPKVIEMIKKYLGPDIALLGKNALWINVPNDTNPVLLKGLHLDAWTGTSVNTIFAKTFFTDVDQYNGLSVCPGTHLYGMTPVKNRGIDPLININPKSINLSNIKTGDMVIWHPLLIHSTTGHSGENIRISLTARFTSTETPFSSQERSLGYTPLSVGPMNQILRLIGNDYLTPLRTYDGFVGVDKRLKKLYGFSKYETEEDYSKLIEED